LDHELIPIGRVRNECKEPSLKHREGDLEMSGAGITLGDMVSELEVDPRFQDALDGVEGFSHIVVVYWTGLRKLERLKVHPAGQQDIPLKGIFSTRSPARPNPLAITTVELLERNGNVLRVRGLDAIDGSMLVDLKPFLPIYDIPPWSAIPQWMEEIMSRFSD